jgi:hypothetical protein
MRPKIMIARGRYFQPIITAIVIQRFDAHVAHGAINITLITRSGFNALDKRSN